MYTNGQNVHENLLIAILHSYCNGKWNKSKHGTPDHEEDIEPSEREFSFMANDNVEK
jgi:hypothetical protein